MTPRRDRLVPKEAPAPPLGNRHDVLVVDDDEDLRDCVADLVREAGYRVTVASDGREALEALEVGPLPTMLVLDIRMPRMDGLELLRHIGSRPRLRGIRVCVLTAERDHVPARADHLLSKPVDSQRLLALVREHCGARGRAPS